MVITRPSTTSCRQPYPVITLAVARLQSDYIKFYSFNEEYSTSNGRHFSTLDEMRTYARLLKQGGWSVSKA